MPKNKNHNNKGNDRTDKSEKKEAKKEVKNPFLRFLLKIKYYVFEDESPIGWIVAFAVMFLFLKFLVIPGLTLALHTNYPIVAVISGSMEHRLDEAKSICGVRQDSFDKKFDSWWDLCGWYYEKNFNLSEDKFKDYPQKNGFNIGDVMILQGTKPENLKIGDIIVFEGGRAKPIIHRIVRIKVVDEKYYFTTKGDHNPESYAFEKDIPQDQVIGRAVFKIPLVGYVKIIAVNVLNGIVGIFK